MSVNMDGVMSKINDAASKASGGIPIYIVFNSEFMKRCTKFPSIKKLLDEAGVTDVQSFEAWDFESRNKLIKEYTVFSTWDEFEYAASKEYAINKLIGRLPVIQNPSPDNPIYDITIQINISVK